MEKIIGEKWYGLIQQDVDNGSVLLYLCLRDYCFFAQLASTKKSAESLRETIKAVLHYQEYDPNKNNKDIQDQYNDEDGYAYFYNSLDIANIKDGKLNIFNENRSNNEIDKIIFDGLESSSILSSVIERLNVSNK